MIKRRKFTIGIILLFLIGISLNCKEKTAIEAMDQPAITVEKEIPEYFLLRPDVEKAYGYSHAVKIGNEIKVSGAVSMDDEGNPTGIGDMEQQMKNCYADLEKVLAHYGCTFDKKQFPTGSWLGVKELALPEFLIEIELEVHK